VEDDKLGQTLEDIKLMRASGRGVMIKSEGEQIVVVPSKVLYIESDNNNVRIITTDGTLVTRMKLTDAVDILNDVNDTIRRVHRCTAVNMSHVGRIRDKQAVMDEGSVVGISRLYLKEFKEELYEYIKRTAR
jgi:DNA-binding LytR/AlgR family response regulator